MPITLQELDAGAVESLESNQELRRMPGVKADVSPETAGKLEKDSVVIIDHQVYECSQV